MFVQCIANGGAYVSMLEECVNEGENPVCHAQPSVHGVCLLSHTPWHWNANWVVSCMQRLIDD